MPASIRIIKIVRDRNPVSGEEEEAYTVEIECEADNAKELEKELIACPYGEEIMDLLHRANFIPKGKSDNIEDMKIEEAKRIKIEEGIREEGREEIRERYIVYLRKKNKLKAADILDELVEKEKAELEAKEEGEET